LDVIGNKEVGVDGSRLYLPDFNTDVFERWVVVEVGVSDVLGVVDLRVDPLSLVGGVRNSLWSPRSLELGVRDSRGLPLSVKFIIPISRLGSLRVVNFSGDIIVSFWLNVFRIVDVGLVNPVSGLGDGRVVDLLGLQNVPVLFNVTRSYFLVVLEDLESVVRVKNEGVDMSVDISLGGNILLDEVVLILVGQDSVGSSGGTTNIRAKHDVVGRFTIVALLVDACRVKLDVSTSTVDYLVLLQRVLQDESLVLVGELRKFSSEGVETSVFRGFQSSFFGFVGEVFTSRKSDLSTFASWSLFRGDPS
jgi:hypothetical protein